MDQQPAVQQSGQAPPTSQAPGVGSLTTKAGLTEFLNFRYMITPPLITILWILSVVTITLVALFSLNSSVLGAIIGWIVGMIWIRVVFEVMIVLFRINDGIQTIARRP
jgi:hypothetical protein